jgi:hypothetical protein
MFYHQVFVSLTQFSDIISMEFLRSKYLLRVYTPAVASLPGLMVPQLDAVC